MDSRWTRSWLCAQLSLLLSTLLSFPHLLPPLMDINAAATSHNSDSNYDVHRLPVPKFELVSRSANSIIVRMINAEMVARLEMKITIYDLDRLREFRQSEFTAAHYRDQLFSFDGLTPETWFAVRIEYRFLYNKLMTRRSNTSTPALYAISKLGNFPTKQELIVQTKSDAVVASAKLHTGQSAIAEDVGVEDILLRRLNTTAVERAVLHNTANSSAQANGDYALLLAFETGFPLRPKLRTLVVPELWCFRGTIKPPALEVHATRFNVSFDLSRVIQHQQNTRDSISSNQLLRESRCFRYCLFPYIRAEILDRGEQTFRGRELCGDPATGDIQQRPNEQQIEVVRATSSGRNWDEWNRARARAVGNVAVDAGPWRFLSLVVLTLFTRSIRQAVS